MFLLLFVQLNKQKNNKTQLCTRCFCAAACWRGKTGSCSSALPVCLSGGMMRFLCARISVLLWQQVCFGC